MIDCRPTYIKSTLALSTHIDKPSMEDIMVRTIRCYFASALIVFALFAELTERAAAQPLVTRVRVENKDPYPLTDFTMAVSDGTIQMPPSSVIPSGGTAESYISGGSATKVFTFSYLSKGEPTTYQDTVTVNPTLGDRCEVHFVKVDCHMYVWVVGYY